MSIKDQQDKCIFETASSALQISKIINPID